MQKTARRDRLALYRLALSRQQNRPPSSTLESGSDRQFTEIGRRSQRLVVLPYDQRVPAAGLASCAFDALEA
jgi:hypothetical protein